MCNVRNGPSYADAQGKTDSKRANQKSMPASHEAWLAALDKARGPPAHQTAGAQKCCGQIKKKESKSHPGEACFSSRDAGKRAPETSTITQRQHNNNNNNNNNNNYYYYYYYYSLVR